MNNKIFVLAIVMLFITGCTVTYDLNIEDSKVYEKVNLNVDSTFNSRISELSKMKQYNHLSGNNTTYYNFSSAESDSGVKLSYDYQYNFENFEESRALSECFSAFNVLNDYEEETLRITTSNKFNCLNYNDEFVDSVTINIKTNHKVINHNADKVENDTYTWEIKSSMLDKPIDFTIDRNPKDTTVEDTIRDVGTLLIVIGIVAGIGVIVLIYLKIRSKNVNKI